MSLERYRVPASVREGEWIELPGGARFLVKLPSSANRLWQRESLRLLADRGDLKLGADGRVDLTRLEGARMAEWIEERLKLFRRVCVIEGPSGFDLEALEDEYFPALEKLFELAEARAEAQAALVERATGELQAS